MSTPRSLPDAPRCLTSVWPLALRSAQHSSSKRVGLRCLSRNRIQSSSCSAIGREAFPVRAHAGWLGRSRPVVSISTGRILLPIGSAPMSDLTTDRRVPGGKPAAAARVSRRISWWIRCRTALAKRLPEDDPCATAASERLKAAARLYGEAQELWLRGMQRFEDLTPLMMETHEMICRLDGESPEEALEPPAEAGENAGIALVLGQASPCVECGEEVGGGLLGWRLGEGPGPLCNACLSRSSPDLAALMALVARAMHVGAERMAGNDDPGAGERVLLELARRYARASAAWPLRPTGLIEWAFKTHQRMVERYGPFYYEELPLRTDPGGQEEN